MAEKKKYKSSVQPVKNNSPKSKNSSVKGEGGVEYKTLSVGGSTYFKEGRGKDGKKVSAGKGKVFNNDPYSKNKVISKQHAVSMVKAKELGAKTKKLKAARTKSK